MSRIDYASLRSKEPALADVWSALAKWRGDNPAKPLDPALLAADLRGIPAERLSIALAYLVDRGLLRRLYCVIAPTTGTFVEEEFSSPDAIPSRLRDRYERTFDTEEAEIVSVFREAR